MSFNEHFVFYVKGHTILFVDLCQQYVKLQTCVFLERKVTMKGKKGDEFLAKR